MNTSDTPIPDAGAPVTDPVAVARLHEQMLVPNFPASELMSAEMLVDEVARGACTVRAAGDPTDPSAVAVTTSFADSPAVLLAYFATRADQRGRGIGSTLLTGLLAGISEEPGVSVVLAEVEHPGYHRAHPAHGDPAARLRFYGRLGGRILEVPYFQPPVDETQDAVYGMLLLALAPAPRWVVGGRLVPAAGVAGALADIMGDADPARFPAAPALDAARDPRGVRLLAVDDLASAPVAGRPAG